MFVNKLFTYPTCAYLKSSAYYSHMKTKILTDFQICISVLLRISFALPEYSNHSLYFADAFCISSPLLWKVLYFHTVVFTEFSNFWQNFNKSFPLISQFSPNFKFILLEMFFIYSICTCIQCVLPFLVVIFSEINDLYQSHTKRTFLFLVYIYTEQFRDNVQINPVR